MPTTHVEPGCEPLLQDIANTLWKSRKVVVITGAGISTNSGIPDFRSENGLYSLIQAQFDAAQQQSTAGSSDAEAADSAIDQRPTKRQRRAYDDTGRAGQQRLETREIPFPGLRNAATKEEKTLIKVDNAPGEQGVSEVAQGDRPEGYKSGCSLRPGQDTTATAEGPTITVATPIPSAMRLPSPGISGRRMEPTESTAPFPSSPPSIFVRTPRPHHKAHLLDPLPGSSSPLSSPPNVTFDPYQESDSTSCAESSRSHSEEPSSVTTPLLSSQTSFSSRTSLPMMKGRDLFDSQIWACPIRTAVFYTFVSTLREKVRSAEPTGSHRFVSVLRDSRKLVRCYTQNIDQLEERVGLSTSLSLGVGSRYRFSLRAGRNAGGTKGSAKGGDGAPDASQGASQQEEEQQSASQPLQKPKSGQCRDEKVVDGTDVPSTQASQVKGVNGTQESNLEESPPSTQPAPKTTSTSAPPNRGVECVFLHGSLAELRCFVCARTASWEEDTRLADTLAGRQPTCPHCAGATAAREERGKRALGVGKLRPDIVLYGEEHPQAHLISPLVQHDLSLGPDMLLILGTSMRVHGLKVLVREFAKAVHERGGKVVFVNFTKPPESVWADIIDYWVQWDCDAWVGDLQARKPALWLPPGTALPEEEKPKTARSSRRQSAPESSKCKDGAEKAPRKVRDSDGLTSSQKEEESKSLEYKARGSEQVLEEKTSPPSRPPPPKAAPRKPAKLAREPKLNPDAKRPASIRDHKQNGAYLVWKIMEDLQRITGRSSLQAVAPSPNPAPKPKQKRPRKSAPAALSRGKGRDTAESHATPVRQAQPAALASSPMPNTMPTRTGKPPIYDSNASISAAVKNRKRKQTVAWRMVGGVETRISLDHVDEPASPPLPFTPAVLRPAPVPDSRRLPPPTPTTPRAPPPYHAQNQGHSPFTQPAPINPPPIAVDMIDAGFRDTDRLIAQMHQETLASRPATPLALHLPPLKTLPEQQQHQPPTSHQQPDRQQQQQKPKLEPLEPKVVSPGPRKGISSNVGSPIAMMRNPFFYADPLIGWLGYPPAREQPQGALEQYQQQQMGEVPQQGQQGQGQGQQQQGQQQQQQGQQQQRQSGQPALGSFPRQHQHQQPQWFIQGHGWVNPGSGAGFGSGPTERERQSQTKEQEREQERQRPRPRPHVRGPERTREPGSGPGPEPEANPEKRDGPNSGGHKPEDEYNLDYLGGPTERDSAPPSASWCPDEQLRKEQEAALMLSAMSGGLGGFYCT